jgi:hypothetical protein
MARVMFYFFFLVGAGAVAAWSGHNVEAAIFFAAAAIIGDRHG